MPDWVNVRVPTRVFEQYERIAAGNRRTANQEIVSVISAAATGAAHRVEFLKEFKGALDALPNEDARSVAMLVVGRR